MGPGEIEHNSQSYTQQDILQSNPQLVSSAKVKGYRKHQYRDIEHNNTNIEIQNTIPIQRYRTQYQYRDTEHNTNIEILNTISINKKVSIDSLHVLDNEHLKGTVSQAKNTQDTTVFNMCKIIKSVATVFNCFFPFYPVDVKLGFDTLVTVAG